MKRIILSVLVLLVVGTGSAFAQEGAHNLGPDVNSPDSDFGPIVTASGNALYFTSDREGGVGEQDIWVSRREGGKWSKAENLGKGINTKYSEGPDSFSIDEKTMFFTRCDKLDQKGICDIYTAYWDVVKKQWTDIQPLGPEVNSEYNDTNASLSYDGRTLYFISNRPGEDGKLNWDIFVSRKNEGKWGRAERMGPPVNTPGGEIHVMIHPDGTLYFCSDGHGGLGGWDILFSKPEGGKFGEPQNMGETINTTGNDIYFTIPASGDLAYLASNRSGGSGMEDIYSAPLQLFTPREEEEVGGMIVIKGRVVDKSSCGSSEPGAMAECKPVPGAVVHVKSAKTGEVLGQKVTTEAGLFQVSLPAENYDIKITARGFKRAEETISPKGGTALEMINKKFMLVPE
jgi:hypothetical protein